MATGVEKKTTEKRRTEQKPFIVRAEALAVGDEDGPQVPLKVE